MDLLLGDCLDILKSIPDNSVDSLVTDPPAGISFMGKEWDSDKGGRREWTAWLEQVMRECLRVLKPGAHALVWAIPRTSHWTTTAIEDAGFEVRDVITHLFGSGFPKSLDISKALDKAAGAERECVGVRRYAGGHIQNSSADKLAPPIGTFKRTQDDRIETAPATDAAKQWQGFGTALKPAAEFWILARKPLSEKTVAANVLKHGTGGLAIDKCRIGNETISTHGNGDKYARMKTGASEGVGEYRQHVGRFPANLVLSHHEECEQVGVKKVKPSNGSGRASGNTTKDKSIFGVGDTGRELSYLSPDGTETVEDWKCHADCAVKMLDEQSGVSKSPGKVTRGSSRSLGYHMGQQKDVPCPADSGGASRFFYCAKVSSRERNAGLEGMPDKEGGIKNASGRGFSEGDPYKQVVTKNNHPTVKPQKLMRYLCRLITPPGGIVLDPFMGSGSTGCAAVQEGFQFIGIEREAEYLEIARRRIEHYRKAEYVGEQQSELFQRETF